MQEINILINQDIEVAQDKSGALIQKYILQTRILLIEGLHKKLEASFKIAPKSNIYKDLWEIDLNIFVSF